jgi:hypothetical protein
MASSGSARVVGPSSQPPPWRGRSASTICGTRTRRSCEGPRSTVVLSSRGSDTPAPTPQRSTTTRTWRTTEKRTNTPSPSPGRRRKLRPRSTRSRRAPAGRTTAHPTHSLIPVIRRRSGAGREKKRKPPTHRNVTRWNQRLLMVGETGFEPATPWSRTKCSTRLSHSPRCLAGAARVGRSGRTARVRPRFYCPVSGVSSVRSRAAAARADVRTCPFRLRGSELGGADPTVASRERQRGRTWEKSSPPITCALACTRAAPSCARSASASRRVGPRS